MSIWLKNNLIRVYAFDKSYVISSEFNKDEKLQICCSETSINVNQLSTDEWTNLIQSKTNSVSSPSAACVFNGYGCLGLLSTTLKDIQEYQGFNNQLSYVEQQLTNSQNEISQNMKTKQHHTSQQTPSQYFLIFVKEAESVGTIKQSEIMKITDVFILSLNTDLSNSYQNQQNYNEIQSLRTYIDDIR
jgi:hypothetical protein